MCHHSLTIRIYGGIYVILSVCITSRNFHLADSSRQGLMKTSREWQLARPRTPDSFSSATAGNFPGWCII